MSAYWIRFRTLPGADAQAQGMSIRLLPEPFVVVRAATLWCA